MNIKRNRFSWLTLKQHGNTSTDNIKKRSIRIAEIAAGAFFGVQRKEAPALKDR